MNYRSCANFVIFARTPVGDPAAPSGTALRLEPLICIKGRYEH
jgi:hypothetical protein